MCWTTIEKCCFRIFRCFFLTHQNYYQTTILTINSNIINNDSWLEWIWICVPSFFIFYVWIFYYSHDNFAEKWIINSWGWVGEFPKTSTLTNYFRINLMYINNYFSSYYFFQIQNSISLSSISLDDDPVTQIEEYIAQNFHLRRINHKI